MNQKWYKILYSIAKWACLVGMPGVIVLIASLGSIWDWIWAPQICATISALDTCLGTFIGISSGKEARRTDGGLVIDSDGNVMDVVSDEDGKKIIQDGQGIVKLQVMKDSDVTYRDK